MRAVRRRRLIGQSLVETAIVMPFLLILLVGAAQIGVIAYGNVTMDTAAREGARIASERPTNATSFAGNTITYTGCLAADQNANYVVQSVCRNAGPAGIIDTSKLSITITKNVDVTALVPQPSWRLAGSCANGYKLLTGSVNNIPNGRTASLKTTGDNTINVSIPSTTPTFSVCLPNGTQTVSVTVGAGCTGYSDSTSLDPVHTSSWTFNLTANAPCPTPISTTTSLSANPTSISSGQSVTLTSVVTPASGGPPTGTVTFNDTSNGNANLGTVTLDATGQAQLSTSALSVGNHAITATYNPDVNHNGSTSSSDTVSVSAPGTPTTTTLAASPTSTQQGQTVTFTATVADGATPTGTVTFTDTLNGNTTTLGTASLSGGVATLATSALAAGTHSVTATYGGDGTHAGSTSSPVSVAITAPGPPPPPSPPPFTCTDPPNSLSTMYIEVDVSYPVPIFVPFVGGIFANSGNTRIVTIKQVVRIDPCGVTQNQ